MPSQVGGNDALRSFFRRHGLLDESIKHKYNSAAAALYRDRIRALRGGAPPPPESSIGEYEEAAAWRPGMTELAPPKRRAGSGGVGSAPRPPPGALPRADAGDDISET